MSLVVPEELQNLESNCGVFAVWMVLQHCEIDIAFNQLDVYIKNLDNNQQLQIEK